MRARSSIWAILLAVTTPALALPGPLRLAEIEAPKQAPTHHNTVEYVTTIAMDDMSALASARLVLQKSKSAELRKFAALLIESHTASGQQLKLALTQSSAHPILPTTLDSSHIVLLDQLKRANGGEFDTRYIQQQIDAQELALELHQAYARRGEDVALKHFAAAAETRVTLHLTEAQKISHSLGGLQPRA